MKKLISVLVLAAMISFIAQSCKKYEDGPTFSLASKKGRIAGTWTLETATLNGDDVTSATKAILESVTLTKDGDATVLYTNGSSDAATWEFDDDKEYIILTEADGTVEMWEILRLKQKELWVKLVDHDGVREWHLIQ